MPVHTCIKQKQSRRSGLPSATAQNPTVHSTRPSTSFEALVSRATSLYWLLRWLQQSLLWCAKLSNQSKCVFKYREASGYVVFSLTVFLGNLSSVDIAHSRQNAKLQNMTPSCYMATYPGSKPTLKPDDIDIRKSILKKKNLKNSVPNTTNHTAYLPWRPEDYPKAFTYWFQMMLIWKDNYSHTHMASRERPTFGLPACH